MDQANHLIEQQLQSSLNRLIHHHHPLNVADTSNKYMDKIADILPRKTVGLQRGHPVRKYSCIEYKPVTANPALTRRRRHTWTQGHVSPFVNKNIIQEISENTLSKCSSSSSVPEAIEECTSDEEVDEV